jgi:hypothetical protein
LGLPGGGRFSVVVEAPESEKAMTISRRAYLLAVTLMVGLVLGLAGTASASTAKQTLQQPPFPPTDVSLFVPELYSEAPPTVPASQNPSGKNAMRKQLTKLLEKRFGASSQQASDGLSLYDAASTKEIVPSPRLRAALVALKGTVGEPAINGALDGTYSKVYFGTLPCTCDPFAEVVFPPGSTKPEIIFNQRYHYEDFRHLAPTMAHELLHRDFAQNSNKEELVNDSFESLVYGQFILQTPSLVTSGTRLARSNNTELMARLNTRDAKGKLRLFTSQGNLFPDGNFVPYFAATHEPLGDSTPGNAVLKAMVQNVVGPSVTLSSTVDFDDSTLLLLDKKQAVFTPRQLVRLATILKLDTSPPAPTAQEATMTAEQQ